MTAYYGRDLYNSPDKRADVIGCEIEENYPITIDVRTGITSFYVRYVTAFEPSGSSAKHGVGSERLEVSYDAMPGFISKLLTDAKQQNKIKNGTMSVVSGTLFRVVP